jgi:hypothetical protein
MQHALTMRRLLIVAALALTPPIATGQGMSDRQREAGSFSVVVSLAGSVALPFQGLTLTIGRNASILNHHGFEMTTFQLMRSLRYATGDRVIVSVYFQDAEKTSLKELALALQKIKDSCDKSKKTTVYVKLRAP